VEQKRWSRCIDKDDIGAGGGREAGIFKGPGVGSRAPGSRFPLLFRAGMGAMLADINTRRARNQGAIHPPTHPGKRPTPTSGVGFHSFTPHM
jgi:hypothetical protein